MFWQFRHICTFRMTVQKLSYFTGSFASMPIGREKRYQDLIFTAYFGQKNPGITKIKRGKEKQKF